MRIDMTAEVAQGSSPFAAAAQRYVAEGWHVFPVTPRQKPPLTIKGELEHGHLDASDSATQAASWWQRWPTANVGVALEPSGLVVFDIDPRNGGSIEALGRAVDLGSPLTARTASGGWHLVYDDVGVELRSKLDHVGLTGIDVKRNGYIVVAPSVTKLGVYRWDDDELERTPLPLMLVDLARAPAHEDRVFTPRTTPLDRREQRYVDATVNNVCQRIASARDGERHDVQFAGACQLGELVGAGVLPRDRAEKRLQLACAQLYGAAPNRGDLRDLADGLDRGAANPRDIPDEFTQTRVLLARIASATDPMPLIELYAENNPELLRAIPNEALDVEAFAALVHVIGVGGSDAGDRFTRLVIDA